MTDRGFGLAALFVFEVVLSTCREEKSLPVRFSAEMYHDCRAIKQAWEPDYAQLAKRRMARGQNVFLYKSPPEGGFNLYGGLMKAEGDLSDVSRAAIAKGGSWGVTYPDSGCPNIASSLEEHYMERYNRFALTLYTAAR